MNRFTRFFFIFSLLLNLFLAASIGFIVQRLGGWKFAWHRFSTDESSLYVHRKSIFSMLPDKTGSIVFLGDSQIQLGEWREFFGDSLPILNRGISGDHVDGVARRLTDVLRNRPSKIFLCVGANDLLLGKPQPEIENRYREIVQTIRRESPDAVLVLNSILPINNEVKNLHLENSEIQKMNARIGQIAREFALPMIDIFSPLTDSQGNLAQKFTEDGLHLNGAGYLVWRKQLEVFLKK